MSTLETNSIGKYSGNNVSIDDALNLKSYDTAGRDALTSVAGDIIYNTTTGKLEYYDGSAWVQTGDSKVPVQYVVIAGGGSGGATQANGYSPGGGGAGGYRSSVGTESSGGGYGTDLVAFVETGTSYTVTIGGGGAAVDPGSAYYSGYKGSLSRFASIFAEGGGAGGRLFGPALNTNSGADRSGGSGGGGGAYNGANGPAGNGTAGQGFSGGYGASYAQLGGGGGGGGASAAGQFTTGAPGGAGGNGVASSITGTSVTRAGGGGGGAYNNTAGAGGTGGGGAGVSGGTATSGTQYTGGGGGGGGSSSSSRGISGAGGSGIVILRYPDTFTITLAGGATSVGGETSVGTNEKYIQIETSGTVSFA